MDHQTVCTRHLSYHLYDTSVLRSLLHKAIRQKWENLALFAALELCCSGMINAVLRRIINIAAEDVGPSINMRTFITIYRNFKRHYVSGSCWDMDSLFDHIPYLFNHFIYPALQLVLSGPRQSLNRWMRRAGICVMYENDSGMDWEEKLRIAIQNHNLCDSLKYGISLFYRDWKGFYKCVDPDCSIMNFEYGGKLPACFMKNHMFAADIIIKAVVRGTTASEMILPLPTKFCSFPKEQYEKMICLAFKKWSSIGELREIRKSFPLIPSVVYDKTTTLRRMEIRHHLDRRLMILNAELEERSRGEMTEEEKCISHPFRASFSEYQFTKEFFFSQSLALCDPSEQEKEKYSQCKEFYGENYSKTSKEMMEEILNRPQNEAEGGEDDEAEGDSSSIEEDD